MFTKTQKVYFGHIDKAGIVYHPHFIDYFNQAYEDFLEELGFDEKNLQAEHGVRAPVVNVDVDFTKPMGSGDRLKIHVTVQKLGSSSMRFHFDTTDAHEEHTVVEGTVTRVTVDDEFRPTPIPDEIREALEPHLETGNDEEG
jgi:acyl-CoA thioester hydrolase